MSVGPHRYTERPRESKVGQLQIIVLVNEEILRLQVAVKDPMRVTVDQS